MGRPRLFLVLALGLLILALAVPVALPQGRFIVLATTTSTEDSGLLDYLLPQFAAQTGIQVHEIAVGTGQALGIASRGDADVVLVHAPKSEQAFVAAGDGVDRVLVMYNYFILVGPAADPAAARGDNATAAFQHIAACRCPFASRGDGSGTLVKELQLWASAGLAPGPSEWYKETGQGMGATLLIANEFRAYTLADDGTYAVMRPRLNLAVIVENQPPLLNQYSVILVNQTKHPNVRHADAKVFHDWLIGPIGQDLIRKFVVNDRHLFTPNAP
ncbi:MAG: hypothetical protein E6K18_04790 [Methanobacteriota archaeon]|nr:MAG: hypothetical protein E6K18_04790 [Euryarchaeota archaeon]